MNTLNGIKTRQLGILGLVALGLVLATPAEAAPDFLDAAFIVAKAERGDRVRQDRREARQDSQAEGRDPRASRRDAEREEPRGYGYGYERRQQQRFDEDDRRRGRR